MTGKSRSIFCVILLAVGLAACGANESVLKSGKETPSTNRPAAMSSIDSDIKAMEDANFRWIFVLRRKDGAVIDSEDKGVIKVNTIEANRRVSSDNDRAFVIGTNTQIPPEKMMALYQRFAVEDRSPPPDPNADTNINSNK
jgi:hypothetical protein